MKTSRNTKARHAPAGSHNNVRRCANACFYRHAARSWTYDWTGWLSRRAGIRTHAEISACVPQVRRCANACFYRHAVRSWAYDCAHWLSPAEAICAVQGGSRFAQLGSEDQIYRLDAIAAEQAAAAIRRVQEEADADLQTAALALALAAERAAKPTQSE